MRAYELECALTQADRFQLDITGTAGDFCRVAAQRLDPAQSGLRASGPHGATAIRVLRTYAA